MVLVGKGFARVFLHQAILVRFKLITASYNLFFQRILLSLLFLPHPIIIYGQNVASCLQDQKTLHKFLASKSKYIDPEQKETKIVTCVSLDFKFCSDDQKFDPIAMKENFHIFKDIFSSANIRDDRHDHRTF